MKLTKNDINKNSTVLNCKKCGGRGVIIVSDGKQRPTKNPNRTISFPRAVVCECRRNEIVENSYPLLGNPKIPKIDGRVAEQWAKMFPLRNNYWFSGPSTQFYWIMKAIFVHHRRSSKFMGYIANGLEMILEYYVEQPEGSSRTFHDLVHGMDLVVIVANTKVSNAAVGPGMVELVQARVATGKAIWLFSDGDFDRCTEFSDDLKIILGESFIKKEIKGFTSGKTSSAVLRGGAK